MSTFDERRRARAAWPIRRYTLGEEELTDPRISSDVDERLAMVWELTRSQWELAGKELPRYTRAEAPGCIVRPSR